MPVSYFFQEIRIILMSTSDLHNVDFTLDKFTEELFIYHWLLGNIFIMIDITTEKVHFNRCLNGLDAIYLIATKESKLLARKQPKDQWLKGLSEGLRH